MVEERRERQCDVVVLVVWLCFLNERSKGDGVRGGGWHNGARGAQERGALRCCSRSGKAAFRGPVGRGGEGGPEGDGLVLVGSLSMSMALLSLWEGFFCRGKDRGGGGGGGGRWLCSWGAQKLRLCCVSVGM